MTEDDSVEDYQQVVRRLQEENAELRKAAGQFGELAERLNTALQAERRQAERRQAPRETPDRRSAPSRGARSPQSPMPNRMETVERSPAKFRMQDVHPLEWRNSLPEDDRELLDSLLKQVRVTSEEFLGRQVTAMLEESSGAMNQPTHDERDGAVRDFREGLGDLAGFLCERLASEIRHAVAGGLQSAVADADHKLKNVLTATPDTADAK